MLSRRHHRKEANGIEGLFYAVNLPVSTRHIDGLKRLALWFIVESDQRLEGIAFAMFADRLTQRSRPVEVDKAIFLQVCRKMDPKLFKGNLHASSTSH